MDVTLRAAGPSDAAFLTQMLVEAAFWRPDGPRGSAEEVLQEPQLARYVAGWPQPGDLGVIAAAERPIGAAWLRLFSGNDPGFGFIDEATPEISMGVVPQWRRRGLGTRLLHALLATAGEAGLSTVSLSVESDNHARHLYEQVGFEKVDQAGGSLTMLLRL